MPTSLTDIFQDGVSRNIKLGPGTLYSAGQIQMDPVLYTVKYKCPQHWAKFMEGNSLERGLQQKFSNAAPLPVPPPLPRLRLNIRDLKIRGRRRQRKRR